MSGCWNRRVINTYIPERQNTVSSKNALVLKTYCMGHNVDSS